MRGLQPTWSSGLYLGVAEKSLTRNASDFPLDFDAWVQAVHYSSVLQWL